MKIIFDFKDTKNIIESLCKYFDIMEVDFKNFVLQNKNKADTIHINFARYFNIKLDEKTKHECFIKARCFITVWDEGESFKKYGFLNTRDALIEDTSLNRFLKNNDVIFDFEENKMIAHNIEYELLDSADSNENGNLYLKLFQRNSEREVFLGDLDYSYPTVQDNPEILVDIDRRIKGNLAEKWMKYKNSKCYILSFDINKKYILGFNTLYTTEYNMIDYIEELGYYESQYREKEMPTEFYENVSLLKYCFDNILGGINSFFAIISNEAAISPYEIKMDLLDRKNIR